MVSFLRYRMAGFCLMVFQAFQAQDVPWNAPSVSLISAPLIINTIPMVDGNALTEGDYIGVFHDSGRCYGLARWKDTTNFKISVYGADGITDGFNTGDKLSLKLWLKKENCVLEHISQVSSDDPLVFSNTASNRVNILNFERASVTYERYEYCLNEGIPIKPMHNYRVDDLVFLAGNGLEMDAHSGAIDLAKSQPGVYTVSLTSTVCLANKNMSVILRDFPRLESLPDTFICGDKLTLSPSLQNNQVQWSTGAVTPQVNLTETATIWYRITNNQGCSNADTFDVKKMEIASMNYITDKADCYEKGRLNITAQKISYGKPPYGFRLINQLDNSEVEDLVHVSEGVYVIEVINANGCVLRYQQKVIIEKDCLNDKPVFSPNEDGLDDRYFVNLEGKLEVFDRNGQLRRRLTGPCYFNGDDENGNPLPMGAYMVVSEKRKTVVITIIR